MNLPLSAMVLSAGYGRRLLPLTKTIPKPLIKIEGIPSLDRNLDSLARAGVKKAVINIHYLGEQIIEHVKNRKSPEIIISDERQRLLDSAGGIIKALPILGHLPFFSLNADTFWIDQDSVNSEKKESKHRPEGTLKRLAEAWQDNVMDILLLLVKPEEAIGNSGGTDFVIDENNRLLRAQGRTDPKGWVYGGVAIIHPRIFMNAQPDPQSLNIYFDQAISAKRLYGIQMKGTWVTVSTPESLKPVEDAVIRSRILE